MQHSFPSKQHGAYVIHEYLNVLTDEECTALREFASSRLVESKVYEGHSDSVTTDIRKSTQCWAYDHEHPVVAQISRHVEDLLGIPRKFFEAMQIARYGPGGFYKPHYDACVGTAEFCARMNKEFGSHRYATFLIYLTEEFEGGETHFPRLPFTSSPKKGAALLFYNTTPEGAIIEESLHGGNPLRSGEKWICNKWIHFPVRQELREGFLSNLMERRYALGLGVCVMVVLFFKLRRKDQ